VRVHGSNSDDEVRERNMSQRIFRSRNFRMVGLIVMSDVDCELNQVADDSCCLQEVEQ
jgi:hypothetical protein